MIFMDYIDSKLILCYTMTIKHSGYSQSLLESAL